MKTIANKKETYTSLINSCDFRYLGSTTSSPKTIKGKKLNVVTYIVYLAPANMSGYEVCPCSEHCRQFCLNDSGHSRIESLAGISTIKNARINKTKLFFEDRDKFMKLLIHEIEREKRKAEKNGNLFAVRLNGTSDISPLSFVYEGKNILEIFPDVTFYDYTKVWSHVTVARRYENYDITFSFDGYNYAACKAALKTGHRIAVVFANKDIPEYFDGYKVINGDETDVRFKDPGQVIVGLKYKKTSKDLVNGHSEVPNTPFVVKNNQSRLFA